ncbi:hypothetical protein K9M06_02160 [Candidatus Bipolaricaulota bacterium]|nr:hypothetical protein [Candidatus Bipolaricaulota bacterium]
MKNEEGVLVGVDGGGSSTTVAVVDKEGRLMGIENGGPSRLETMGAIKAKDQISECLKSALKKASQGVDDIEVMSFGFGGLDSAPKRKQAEEIAGEIVPGTRTIIENDAAVGLFSGTFGKPGLALIAGTGTLLVGINGSGDRDRVDGWGHLFGDLGSAYYLGREAVRKSLEHFDGRGRETVLTGMLVEELEMNEISEVMDRFYGRENEAKNIAELSLLVDEAAKRGDKVANSILVSAARELRRSALTLIDKLNMEALKTLRIVLIGGVFNSTKLTKTLENFIQEEHSKANFIRPDWDPVTGAIVFAMKEKKKEIDKSTIRRLKKEFS